MICIFCGNISTVTKNSRKSAESSRIWRRRFCEKCGRLFTTYETPNLDTCLQVLKPDGSTEPFSTEGIKLRILDAFTSTESSADKARSHSEYICSTLLAKILPESKPGGKGKMQIPQTMIDDLALQVLYDYSEKAYYRFLSGVDN